MKKGEISRAREVGRLVRRRIDDRIDLLPAGQVLNIPHLKKPRVNRPAF